MTRFNLNIHVFWDVMLSLSERFWYFEGS